MTGVVVGTMALVLDLANILGGLLLASALLTGADGVRRRLERVADAVARWVPVVGVLALVGSGYWLVVHVTSGPHLFHFEIVGLGVGVALLWERLTGRPTVRRDPAGGGAGSAAGVALLLGVFGVIAVVTGLQGLVTPDG